MYFILIDVSSNFSIKLKNREKPRVEFLMIRLRLRTIFWYLSLLTEQSLLERRISVHIYGTVFENYIRFKFQYWVDRKTYQFHSKFEYNLYYTEDNILHFKYLVEIIYIPFLNMHTQWITIFFIIKFKNN